LLHPLGQIQNGANLVTTFLYNDKLQPCWTYATSGTPPTPLPWNTTSTGCTSTYATGNVLDLKYNFSLGTDNGNVTGITNDRVSNRSQNFTYDQLNRIATAETTSTHATDPTNCWGEAYVYDNPGGPAAWGNLIQINSPSSAYTGCTGETLNLSLGMLTNNQISGWCYDASGNVLAESACPTGPPYAYMYDAENHLTSTAGVTYTYDGDGKRVQKSSGILYWYGMGSDALDETSSTGTMTDEYIFFGGKRIARRDPSNNVVYYFADHLGTSRIVASATGTILDDSDFYPFGGQRVVLSGSGNTYKFTGQERDSESGLDNFKARYMGSTIGRFMSPDPLLNSGRPSNPQTWNRYNYALNNPLKITDPTGLYDVTCTDKKCKKAAAELKKGLTDLQKKADKMNDGLAKQRLETSLKVLGAEGDHNGVNVTFAPVAGTAAGQTTFDVDPQTSIVNAANITLDPNKISSSNDYAIDAAHEGTHIEDELTGFLSVTASGAGFPQLPMLTPFQTEYRGYQTSAWAAQALGEPILQYADSNGTNVIWNSSWKADRQVLNMDKGITDHVTSIPGHPEDPGNHNPWPN
jgi:RHS repeat-associated protein